jgi:GntR family transcriptional regulator
MNPTPTLSIDLASATPVYRQIANALRALLVGGSFRPDDTLPTVRQLATDLGVHHNTVAEAYRVLAGEGWLDLKRRRGVTVLARELPRPDPALETSFLGRLRELVAEATAHGVSKDLLARELRELAHRLLESEQPGETNKE